MSMSVGRGRGVVTCARSHMQLISANSTRRRGGRMVIIVSVVVVVAERDVVESERRDLLLREMGGEIRG